MAGDGNSDFTLKPIKTTQNAIRELLCGQQKKSAKLTKFQITLPFVSIGLKLDHEINMNDSDNIRALAFIWNTHRQTKNLFDFFDVLSTF